MKGCACLPNNENIPISLSDEDAEALALSLPFVLQCSDLFDPEDAEPFVMSAGIKLITHKSLTPLESKLAMVSCEVACDILSNKRKLDITSEERAEMAKHRAVYTRFKNMK